MAMWRGVMLLVAVFAVLGVYAGAQVAPGVGEKRVSIAVEHADLREALRRIAGQAGAQVRVAPDVKARVTAELHDVLFEVALENLLRSAETWQALAYYKKDGVYLVEVKHLQRPEVRARVYLGARAETGSVIVGADRYRLPDQLVLDRPAGRIVAVGALVDDTPGREGYVAAWGMRGQSLGQWEFRGSIRVATPLYRRAGRLSAFCDKLVRTRGELADYEWYLMTVPLGRTEGLRVVQTPDTPPTLTPAQTRLDQRLRKMAEQVGWVPATWSQAGSDAARERLTVHPGNVANRIAMNSDLSVVVFAHDVIDVGECIAVRQAGGRYKAIPLAPLLSKAARGDVDLYSVCAERDRVAVGLYAGEARKPLVVCLRVTKAGAKVVAVKQGLLASPVVEL